MVDSRIAYEAQQAAAFVAGKFEDNIMSPQDMDDINQYMQMHGLANNQDATRLMSSQLEEMGILPELLYTEYGTDAALSAHAGGDNRYDRSDVNAVVRDADTPFEQMLAQSFADHYAAIAGLDTRQNHPEFWQRANGQLENITQDDFNTWIDGEYEYGEVDDISTAREGAEAALVAFSNEANSDGSFVLSELRNGRPVEFGAAERELSENPNLTPLQREALQFIADNENGISAMNTSGTLIDTRTHVRGWNGILPDRIAGFNPEQLTMFAENLGTNLEIAQRNVADEAVLSAVTAPLEGVAVAPVGADIAPNIAPNADGSSVHKDAQGRVFQIDHPGGDYTVFGRDASGNVNSVRASDGSYSYTLTNNVWQDANGNPVSALTVNTDGSFLVTKQSGASETFRTDGSIVTSQGGHVTKVDRADGTSMAFTYDSQGNLISATPNAGPAFIRVGNSWTQQGVNNDQPWAANLAVDATGNFSFTQPNGERYTIGPSGLMPAVASAATAEQVTPTTSGGTPEANSGVPVPVGTNHDIAVNLNSFQDTKAFLWRDITDADGTFKTADEVRSLISRYGANSRAGQALSALLNLYTTAPGMEAQSVDTFMASNLRTGANDRIAVVNGGGGPSAIIAGALGRTPTSAEIASIMSANGYDNPSQWSSMATGQRLVIPEGIT